MHKVCHCDAVAAVVVRGGTGRKKMNETKAIFSFCFSQDEFVKKKFLIDLKRLWRGRNNVRE